MPSHADDDHAPREQNGAPPSRRWKWLRRLGLLIALVLIAAAIVMVLRQKQLIIDAWNSIHDHPPMRLAWLTALITGSIVANLALTGALFHLLTSRYGKVGALEMQVLIAAATLMNFVPLRPGFFGRIAYHRAYNNIAIGDSAKVVLQTLALSAIIVGYLTICIAIGSTWQVDVRLTMLAPVPALVLAGGLARGLPRVYLWASAVRLCEALVIALRYFAAFWFIGSPIHFNAALAFACVSVIATMTPFLSNGLGLREWAVGLVAPLVTAYQMELGVTADLMLRAAELLVVTIVGSAAFAWLLKHRSLQGRVP